MNLDCAEASGAICAEVRKYAAFPKTPSGMAMYRAVGQCPCGRLVPVHICAVWHGQEPSLVNVSIGGETCPDCGRLLGSSDVAFLGINSPGYPALPAVGFSVLEAQPALLAERDKSGSSAIPGRECGPVRRSVHLREDKRLKGATEMGLNDFDVFQKLAAPLTGPRQVFSWLELARQGACPGRQGQKSRRAAGGVLPHAADRRCGKPPPQPCERRPDVSQPGAPDVVAGGPGRRAHGNHFGAGRPRRWGRASCRPRLRRGWKCGAGWCGCGSGRSTARPARTSPTV